jgi:hypothetical protein
VERQACSRVSRVRGGHFVASVCAASKHPNDVQSCRLAQPWMGKGATHERKRLPRLSLLTDQAYDMDVLEPCR